MIDIVTVCATFQSVYGVAPRLFAAPGRVNLIGEHTDYNEGFVLPVALDRRTIVAGAARTDRRVRVCSLAFNESAEFSLDDDVPPGSWLTYVAGMAHALGKRGHALAGADLLIASDVPAGAGLSSSAALEVATGLALLSLAGLEADKIALAGIAQEVEHDYVGIKSGLMDPLASLLGRRGHALLLDCRTLATQHIPLHHDEMVFVICDSRVKHRLAASAYNTRRAECEQGVTLLRGKLPNVKSLRDVSSDALARWATILPENVHRRCRHIVSENERVQTAAKLLSAGDFAAFGRLMLAAHASQRDDFAVSCAEMDTLVDIAARIEGVAGARMTGGGFGGCTVNLLLHDALDTFRETVKREYHAATGYEPLFYVIQASDGAGEITY